MTSPILTGSTKCTLPCTVFLSATRRAEQVLGGDAVERRNGSVAPRCVSRMSTLSSAERCRVDLGQVDGGAHAQRHRLAVQKARVGGLGFERVPEGVAEIQDAPQIAFPLVGGDHFGFHAHRFGDDVVDGAGDSRQHVALPIGEELEQAGGCG